MTARDANCFCNWIICLLSPIYAYTDTVDAGEMCNLIYFIQIRLIHFCPYLCEKEKTEVVQQQHKRVKVTQSQVTFIKLCVCTHKPHFAWLYIFFFFCEFFDKQNCRHQDKRNFCLLETITLLGDGHSLNWNEF